MNRFAVAASTLSAAVGLALALSAPVQRAVAQGDTPKVVKDNMMRAQKYHLEKCYGINAAGKNDCAQGAHSCAGQADVARDPKSFVLLPHGDCEKIAGGALTTG